MLVKKLSAKYIPDIRFINDEEFKIYDNINKIIKNG